MLKALHGFKLGVLINYAATVIHYALAIAYIILLVKLIPLKQYGYLNAITAVIASISLLYPIEATSLAASRSDASLLFTLTLIMSISYSILILITVPLLVKAPLWLMPIIYIYAFNAIIQSLGIALGNYLWSKGDVIKQGEGSLLGSLVYRLSEVALILIIRNVYAIALSLLLSNIIVLIYYRLKVNGINISLSSLSNIRSVLINSMQYWIAFNLTMGFSNIMNYITYLTYGAAASGIYGLTINALGLVSGFSNAAGKVYGSARVNNSKEVKGFIHYSLLISIMLTIIALAASPFLLPFIFTGQYSSVTYYLMIMLPITPLLTINSIYTMENWVNNEGWRAVKVTGIALIVSIIAFTFIRGLGLVSVIIADYIDLTLMLILYKLKNPQAEFK